MHGIGHNNPPVERFDLAHRPMLAQMDIDAIVGLIDRLETELRPLRDEAIGRHERYRGLTNAWGAAPRYGVTVPGGFDHDRFRELQSILADCRIEIRERRNPKHPQAWPSEHEKSYAQRCRFGT